MKQTSKYLANKRILDLSLLNYKKKQKLLSTLENDIKKFNINIKFNINNLPDEIKRGYYKKYLKYTHKNLNSNIISMFFIYISSSNIIPLSFKNNHDFLEHFLKIIMNLLINEIELVIISLIFDKIGWVEDEIEPWTHIQYICLAAQKISSSNKLLFILLKVIDKNNFGFLINFNRWMNNSNIKEILQSIKICDVNERFRDFRHPIYLNENQKKFINYNEIATKISSIPNQINNNKKVNLYILSNIQSNTNNNINIVPSNTSNINIDNPFENSFNTSKNESINLFGNQNQTKTPQKNFDLLQFNNSIGGRFDLNRNNSYIPLNSGEKDEFKIQTFVLNK